MSTTLYRAFDRDGALLYIGISDEWPKRMFSHARTSSWFATVATLKLTARSSLPRLASRKPRTQSPVPLRERPVLNVSEVAELCGKSSRTIYAWIDAGLPVIPHMAEKNIARRQLDAWLNGRSVA